MKGVEEIVVVVDREIDGPGPGLDNLLEVLEHVDVGEAGQLFELLSLEERHNKLTERILAPGLVRVDDHGIVGLHIVAQLQVMGEQDVAKNGLKESKINLKQRICIP